MLPPFAPLPVFQRKVCAVRVVSQQGRVVEDLACRGHCVDGRSGGGGLDPRNAKVEPRKYVAVLEASERELDQLRLQSSIGCTR